MILRGQVKEGFKACVGEDIFSFARGRIPFDIQGSRGLRDLLNCVLVKGIEHCIGHRRRKGNYYRLLRHSFAQ